MKTELEGVGLTLTEQLAAPTQSDPNSRLALIRTRLSQDRTMLSWIRTSTSLITFGFGVHQVFRIMPGASTGPSHSMAAYHFGSVMVAIGLMTLVFATIENRGASTVLADAYPISAGYPAQPWPYARILGTFIGLLGIGALLVMQVGS